MKTPELISLTAPTVGRLGASYYFTDETVAVGRTIGLDGFRFYFLGRGGVLGDVEWPVVLSAFGYFEPGLMAKMWTTARERATVAPRDAARLHLGSCADLGRAHLGEVSGLGAFCEAAEAVVARALADPAGLTLFAGVATEALPADLPGRALQLVATLRELRGSAHLTAVAASGLATPVAHRARRPDFLEMFGWSTATVAEPTDADRHLLREADTLTDAMVTPAYAVLDADGAAALVAGLDAMAAAVPSW